MPLSYSYCFHLLLITVEIKENMHSIYYIIILKYYISVLFFYVKPYFIIINFKHLGYVQVESMLRA